MFRQAFPSATELVRASAPLSNASTQAEQVF